MAAAAQSPRPAAALVAARAGGTAAASTTSGAVAAAPSPAPPPHDTRGTRPSPDTTPNETAMEIVKKNLVSIICGVVALLALVAVFVWPLDGYYQTLQEKAKKRAEVQGKVSG